VVYLPSSLAAQHQIPPLILDGLCACTFYLVFKEPTLASRPRISFWSRPPAPYFASGELIKFIPPLFPCQQVFQDLVNFFGALATSRIALQAGPTTHSGLTRLQVHLGAVNNCTFEVHKTASAPRDSVYISSGIPEKPQFSTRFRVPRHDSHRRLIRWRGGRPGDEVAWSDSGQIRLRVALPKGGSGLSPKRDIR
jgi:hypothetical protein